MKKIPQDLQLLMDTLDQVFQEEEPQEPKAFKKCKGCGRKHELDLDIYKQIVQQYRLVFHCYCGSQVEFN